MILIGQYDSPFVRRVAIALRLYDIKFQHKPWSTFGDAELIAPYNPLRRVPTLALDGGEAQITGALDALETERAAIKTPYLFGERIGHADIAVACVLRFTREAHSRLFDGTRYPLLKAHAARCEALPAFSEIAQALSPPSGD